MKNLSDTNTDFSASVAIFAPCDFKNIEVNQSVVVSNIKGNNFSTYDEKIFEEIYNKHLQRIISFAYSYLNDLGDAENIAHDVFISYWHARQNNSAPHEDILPYLITATKNKCLNVIKKNNHAKKYTETTLKEKMVYLNSIALESGSTMSIYQTDIESCLNRAVGLMKPKIRKTFLMSRMSGLKNKEIAEIEGIAESTVEARMSSALLILRKILKDYIR